MAVPVSYPLNFKPDVLVKSEENEKIEGIEKPSDAFGRDSWEIQNMRS